MKLLYITILFSFIMLGCQSNHAITAVEAKKLKSKINAQVSIYKAIKKVA